jgi:anti-sigma factor RsiW
MQPDLNESQLSAYLDGQLTDAERAAVDAALQESAELRQSLAELRQLREAFQALPRYKLGDDFADRVLAAATAAEQRGESSAVQPAATITAANQRLNAPVSRRNWLVGIAAVAGLAACALALVQWNRSGEQPTIARNGTEQSSPESPDRAPTTPVPAAPDFAALHQLKTEQGEALVIRVRIPAGVSPRAAIDAALAQTGIEQRLPSDITVAGRVGAAYRTAVREQGVKKGSTPSAEDVVFIEAPVALVEDALLTLAGEEHGRVAFEPAMKVAVAPSAASGRTGEGEGEGGDSSNGTTGQPSGPFAQRLNPRIFLLPKADATAVSPEAGASNAADANRKVRVLILVEPAQP